jgi:hypothetical protein
MTTLHNMPVALRARGAHLFSKALLLEGTRQEEAAKQRIKAQRLRQLLPGGRDVFDEDDDSSYDKLVNVLDR